MGALLSGLLSDLAGRKVTVIIGASLYALGGTLQTSSFFLWSVWSGQWWSGSIGYSCVNFNLFQTCFSRMLFPARIISGIGTGYVYRLDYGLPIVSMTWFVYRITLQACPLYIAEMAPKERRGILVSMVNAVGATGLVVRTELALI